MKLSELHTQSIYTAQSRGHIVLLLYSTAQNLVLMRHSKKLGAQSHAYAAVSIYIAKKTEKTQAIRTHVVVGLTHTHTSVCVSVGTYVRTPGPPKKVPSFLPLLPRFKSEAAHVVVAAVRVWLLSEKEEEEEDGKAKIRRIKSIAGL